MCKRQHVLQHPAVNHTQGSLQRLRMPVTELWKSLYHQMYCRYVLTLNTGYKHCKLDTDTVIAVFWPSGIPGRCNKFATASSPAPIRHRILREYN